MRSITSLWIAWYKLIGGKDENLEEQSAVMSSDFSSCEALLRDPWNLTLASIDSALG